MGLIETGILGGVRNKVGSVVGSFWRSLNVLRAMPRKSNKAPTREQLDQQIKFALITAMLSYIADLINIGYKSSSAVATPMNVAVAENLKNAITGVSPDFTVDYSKLTYSKGKLALPFNAEVQSAAGAKLNFSWSFEDQEEDEVYMNATDKLTLLVYSPDKDRFAKVKNVVERSALTYSFSLPLLFSGDDVHCYLSFNSTKRKGLVSDTLYLGTVMVL